MPSTVEEKNRCWIPREKKRWIHQCVSQRHDDYGFVVLFGDQPPQIFETVQSAASGIKTWRLGKLCFFASFFCGFCQVLRVKRSQHPVKMFLLTVFVPKDIHEHRRVVHDLFTPRHLQLNIRVLDGCVATGSCSSRLSVFVFRCEIGAISHATQPSARCRFMSCPPYFHQHHPGPGCWPCLRM